MSTEFVGKVPTKLVKLVLNHVIRKKHFKNNQVIPPENWHSLGNFVGIDKEKMEIKLENGEMKIEYIKPHIVKIFYGLKKEKKPLSFAIEKDLDSFTQIFVSDRKEVVDISPKGSKKQQSISIIIDKDNNLCIFKSPRGEIYTETIPMHSEEKWYRSIKKSNKPREHYFGFGEATGELDKVNTTVAFWNTDSLPYDNNRKNLYQSQPIQVTIQENGLIYAIIYDNPYKSIISVEKREEGYITEYSVAGGGITYYLIISSSISDLFSELTYILGKVPLPPLNSLGHHQSLWSYKNEEEVRKVAETFRNKQIPCDFIHLDIDYMDGYRIFTWNKERFPNIKELSSELLEKHNIKLLAITDPGVKVDPEYFMYKEGIKDNHFVKNEDGKTLFEGEVWPGHCHFPDFSQQKTREWFGSKFKILDESGIEAFWIDMNEPSVFSELGTIPETAIHPCDGKNRSHAEMHNQYGHLMSKAVYEGLKKINENKRVFILTRSAYIGTQRYAGSWTGDNNAEWGHLRMSLPMLMNMAISGQVMIGPDIGGFLGKPSAELLIRWYQAGLFYPFFRNHSINKNCRHEPWVFGKRVEKIIRKTIQLRYQLLPYLYTSLVETCKTGIPLFKALFIDYIDDEEVYNKQWLNTEYLVGNSLLIAPILKKWRRKRKVYFPKGTKWFSFDGSQIYEGGKTYTISIPLDSFNFIFIKEGSIIPIIDKDIQSTEEVLKEPLTLLICGEKEAKGEVYLDDGYTMNYEKEDFEIARFEAKLQEKESWNIYLSREGKKKKYINVENVKQVGHRTIGFAIFEE